MIFISAPRGRPSGINPGSPLNIAMAAMLASALGSMPVFAHDGAGSRVSAYPPAVQIAVAPRFGNEVTITIEGGRRCFKANGLPDHKTGRFPNGGNPNSIAPQDIRYCVDLTPSKGDRPVPQRGSIGVALNGVTIRPGTADWWDSSTRRGFSRNRQSGWNLEGLGSAGALGIDDQNAHVDNRGLYHYHGVADALVAAGGSSLLGYAADGFEIHYVGAAQMSSYRLKPGVRSSPPGGAHDGRFVQDWAYIAGAGSLDACNGGSLDGRFVYFATDGYPFFPRCLWGKASHDFGPGGGAGVAREGGRRGPGDDFGPGNGPPPPRR